MKRKTVFMFCVLLGMTSPLLHYLYINKNHVTNSYGVPQLVQSVLERITNRTKVHSILLVKPNYGDLKEYENLYNGTNGDDFLGSPSCQIAKTPLFPPYFNRTWPYFEIPRCDYERKLFRIENQILKILPEFRTSNCCIRDIYRKKNSDKAVRLSKCKPVPPEGMSITKKEHFVVRCGKYANFEAGFPLRLVRNKTRFWDTHKNAKEDLISVIVLGIDTTSRAHAYRSLPETIRLLRTHGFVDFRGFHSVAPSTVYNMVPVLSGQTIEGLIAGGYLKSATGPYDQCPFIWKEFAERNYLTQFIEDSELSTFTWGAYGGFRRKPVDFYHHPLFIAKDKFRITNPLVRRYLGVLRGCMSNETEPNFVLRNLETFLTKFQDYPLFSLAFLSQPFHDRPHALYQMDHNISSFFRRFLQNPALTRKTLFVFWSDHGDRFHGSQSRNSFIAYIERALPFLFIRLPDILNKPPHSDALRQNADQLTTPFDIYQTLAHVLHWNDPRFQPVVASRSSLLVPVPSNRDCESTKLQLHTCVCNVSANEEAPVSTFLQRKMLNFAIESLNDIVRKSKYRTLCAQWTSRNDLVRYARRVRKSKESSVYILSFKALPGEAVFEVRLKVRHKFSYLDRLYLAGRFVRLSWYGSQGVCIGNETAEEKRMKELCYCRTLL